MTFDEWWDQESGWDGERLAEYHIARAAWNKAIELAADQVEQCEGTDFNLRYDFSA